MIMTATASDVLSFTTIANLPDECLREVMFRIPIQNRIHLRKVCKKWCEVIDECWSAVKKCGCDKPTEERHGIFGHDDSVIIATSRRKIYEGIMKNCGKFLTHLNDNIKELDVSILPFAVKHCRNIVELMTMVASKADDKHLNQLLAINPKIRVLKLAVKFKNAKMCLRTIATDVLEELRIISGEHNIHPPAILNSQKQIVRKAKSLRKLVTYLVDDELLDLIGQKTGLEMLGVTYRGNSLKNDTFHPVLKLKNLRELAIGAALKIVRGGCQPVALPVTDDFLIVLADNLKLLEVIFLDASHVTDRGFVHLASLQKLRTLRVTYCPGVTDKFLYLFSGLEELNLSECPIRDEGVIELLKKAQDMRVLKLSGTLITNKTLIAAMKETKKRENGICLELFTSGANTTPWTISESSPLLKIVD